MAVLEAHDVTKTYREGREVVPVLKGVHLTLERGEFVALEGPSGSGKTTLLFVLGCLLTPCSGSVVVEGERIDPARADRLARRRRESIGFVFQHGNLFGALTARENVEYTLNLRGITGRAARRETERLLDAVGLAGRRDARPRDLSGGERQRVAIARALTGGAPIVLADEPTANLDSQLGAQILDLFRRLAREEDRAMLIVTHDPSVRAVVDRVVRMRDGRLAPAEAAP